MKVARHGNSTAFYAYIPEAYHLFLFNKNFSGSALDIFGLKRCF